MNKTSVLHAPSWAHQGEFVAASTINQFAGCVEGTADATSGEGVTYLQTIRKLAQISTDGQTNDMTALMYLGYKWPTEDDYFLRNGLSNLYITAGEGIIGLQMLPGVRIQEYIGPSLSTAATDYTNSSGVKIGLMAPGNYAATTSGTRLYFTSSGQLTTATVDSTVVRALWIEGKGPWATIEFIQPYKVG